MARPSPATLRPLWPSTTPAKRKGIPLSPLAKQILHDMQLAGFGQGTHESYLRAVRKFAQWTKKSPDTATDRCFLRQRKLLMARQPARDQESRTGCKTHKAKRVPGVNASCEGSPQSSDSSRAT